MDNILFYHQDSKLTWSAWNSRLQDVVSDCATAFAALEQECDVRLVCDPRTLVRFLHKHYRCVRAAGGVVVSSDGHHLLIRRDGMWDLPKGMVECGETLAEAALREVREETGVKARLRSSKPLLKTYHIYNKYGGWHLKQTSWFDMEASTEETPTPQLDEDIDLVEWTDTTQWHFLLQHSYASLQQVSRSISDEKTKKA